MHTNPRLIGAVASNALVAVVLCFTPLFNVLGYEFSQALLLTTIPWALALGWQAGYALIAPLVFILLNAFRVQNCNIPTGLIMYALLPYIGVFYAAAWRFLLIRLQQHGYLRSITPGLIVVGVVHIVLSIIYFYTQPPIFITDALWGYLPGAIYDEAMGLDTRLLAFRLDVLLRALSLFLMGYLIHRHHLYRWHIGIALLVFHVFLTHTMGSRFAYHITRSDIEKALPVVIDHPMFVLHLPPNTHPEQQQRIADDHAFRLDQIVEKLQVTLPFKIHSYIYPNAQEKGRLMGGHHVMFAKPWSHEIHIHGAYAPHDVMAHEMVHAVAAVFGSRIFGASARYELGINMGMVEGLATALAPEQGDLDLHHWAKALMDSPQRIAITTLMTSLGFWQQAPQQAYVAAGSFIRYILDTQGPELLKVAYRYGRIDHTYGVPLKTLEDEWLQFLKTLSPEPTATKQAEQRFKQPSIFKKTCAREVAHLRQEAHQSTPEHAIALFQAVCEHLPDDVNARVDLALAYMRAQQSHAFLDASEHLLSREDLPPYQALRLYQARLSWFWSNNQITEAHDALDHIAQHATSLYDQRLQAAQRWALHVHDAEERKAWGTYLAPIAHAAPPPTQDSTDEPMAHYLRARWLVGHNKFNEALQHFPQATQVRPESIAYEAWMLWGNTALTVENFAQAEVSFKEAQRLAPTSGAAARVRDHIERLRWVEQDKNRPVGLRP